MITKKIIAGKYKNMTINLPSLYSTRSTKSIIKESLFNTLQFDVIDEFFVEVFCGSGSIGLEALSRGASHAYFFEKDSKAHVVLRENCRRIAKNETTCIHGDSFKEFPKFINTLKQKAFFYFDPPFSIRDDMQNIYENTFKLIKIVPKELSHMIVIEHMSSQKMPDIIGKHVVKKIKKFGESSLTYYV
ncbi:MAG: 16S rRNA (guanine(966)-N(2))-methyltransferase RsmD [Sulfurospirillum sp.]|nr:16S rRNA (guanine(966)-N(2))-methyltransferase RsmD [Sulfurospirillum sp.]MBL0703422.1 16S rRNA (guanine(966)-N(2))-methyltransferase RsmD [Sulfurospirillum sp.]